MSLPARRTFFLTRGRKPLAHALALLLPLLVLHTSAAQAAPRGVHLLDTSDSAPVLAPSSVPAAPTAATQPWLMPMLAGAGATAVSVPLSLLVGSRLGASSNNLALAALPALLLFAALPPLAVTWAESWMGNLDSPGAWRFQPALWAALAVHVAATVAAVTLGVSVVNLPSVALFTLVEALLLPSTVTLTMWLTRPPAPDTAALASRHPEPLPEYARLPRRPILPLLALSF